MDPRADSPIGVFDSGVGGLTVLDECLARLPAEDFLYFGDTAWFPYGDKSADQLRGRAEAIGNWLIAKGAKLVVVACNTATAAALAHLQTHLDVPVIGVMTAESHAAAASAARGFSWHGRAYARARAAAASREANHTSCATATPATAFPRP